MDGTGDRLNTWKEIATYLKRGVRTLQRWERDEGLPVHRLPHQKLGSVYAYRHELDEWWKKRGSELTTAGVDEAANKRASFPWPAAIAASCLILIASWRPVAHANVDPQIRIVPVTTFRGSERSPSFSPDGESIAFTWDGENGENTDIYTMRIGATTPVRLTRDPAPDWFPIWSPDGKWIAFLRQIPGALAVFVIPASGGEERKFGEVAYPVDLPSPAMAWRADSRALILADRKQSGGLYGLIEIALDGRRRTLTEPPAGTLATAGLRCPPMEKRSRLCVTPLSPKETFSCWIATECSRSRLKARA